ncbi:MAG: Na+-transporting NADH:ubiquinone oxidoreductase subunit B, partial [Halieaceae bacterium]
MDKMLFGSLKVLPVVIVSYAVGLGVEFIFGMKNGHSLQEGFLVSGMLIPLCLPVTTPLWMVAIATIFAVVIGKEVFGGTGMNIVNVALTARAFLFFAYPTKMSGDKVWIDTDGMATVDGYSGATAL